MIVTKELIKVGQDALVSAFGQDGYVVRFSDTVCDIRRCTSGNRLLCTDGVERNFRRHIDTKRKVVYWSYPNDLN